MTFLLAGFLVGVLYCLYAIKVRVVQKEGWVVIYGRTHLQGPTSDNNETRHVAISKQEERVFVVFTYMANTVTSTL